MQEKRCPACGATFICMHENPAQCQCAGIAFTPEQREKMRTLYNDCLCRKCLIKLSKTL